MVVCYNRHMDAELAWLAGLLEGEGCFFAEKRPGKRMYPRISLEMTDEDVVARVAKMFGKPYHRKNSPSMGSHRKTKYYTRVTGKLAVEWMERLQPLMGVRRQEAIAQLLCWQGRPDFESGHDVGSNPTCAVPEGD